METAEETLARLVAERLKALETNAFAVEKSAGLPADAVRSILRGGKKSGTTLNRAFEVCRALGIEFSIRPQDVSEVPVPEPEGYATLPLHDVELSAGTGRENGHEQVVEQVAFRRSWLKRVGVSVDSARLARVRGDSMEPVLMDGDLVLIDISRRVVPLRPRKPGKPPKADLFAVVDGDLARVKRIEHSSPGRLILHSDNPAYPPEVRDGMDADDLGIIGKVVWWGHTVRE